MHSVPINWHATIALGTAASGRRSSWWFGGLCALSKGHIECVANLRRFFSGNFYNPISEYNTETSWYA